MITELSFIRMSNAFWQALFPGGEDYIRLINSIWVHRFEKPINIEDKPFRRALINNIAFDIFVNVLNNLIPDDELDKFTVNSTQIKSSISREIKALSRLRHGVNLSEVLTDFELLIVKTIAKRLINQYQGKQNLILKPKFDGCGMLFESSGDIYYSDTLVEVKSGQRTFGIQDLRQLYVYAALNYPSIKCDIKKIELCNPRMGFIWSENIDVVSENIAGSSTTEILAEIISYISVDHFFE